MRLTTYTYSLILLTSLTSFAQAASCKEDSFFDSVVLPLFCSNPYAAICGSNPKTIESENEKRRKGVLDVEKPLRDSAVIESAQRLHLTPPTSKSYFDYISQGSDEIKRGRTMYAMVIETAVEKKFKFTFQNLLTDSKNNFLKSIDDNTEISDSDKIKLKASYSNVHMIYASEYIQKFGLERYRKFCGISLDGSNMAFLPATQQMLICPGTIFQAVSAFPSMTPEEAIKAYVKFGIDHELGHNLDDNVKSPDRHYILSNGCFEKTADRVSNDHKNEIIADYWATRSFASQIAEDSKNLTKQMIFSKYAKDGILNFACSDIPKSDSVYGSPEWRLNKVFKNPTIRKAFGCTPTKVANICEIYKADN